MIATTFAFAGFAVPDIDAAHRFYRDVLGLEVAVVALQRYDGFEQDDRGIARGIASGRGPDIGWFTDPAGNIIAVLQNPAGDDAAPL